MKKNLLLSTLFAITLFCAGCSNVEQGRLHIKEKSTQVDSHISQNIIYGQFDIMPQKAVIEKHTQILSSINTHLIPLAVAPDYGSVFAFDFTRNPDADITNSRIVTGNMTQEINMHIINVETKQSVLIGKFMSLKDYRFDETGRYLAFVDGSSRVYLYDIPNAKLEKILESPRYNSYSSVSWSRDSKRLMIDTNIDFDIASGKIISYAIESYTPFIKRRISDSNHIVQMKSNEYNDMIAIYDFDKRSFTSIANGYYIDSDNINVIYTKHFMNSLSIVNLKTLESKSIEAGSIYGAVVMKSTGDVLYTTLNSDITTKHRYTLVRFNPTTGTKKSINIETPTFYISPSEDRLFFVSSSSQNRIVLDIEAMQLIRSRDILENQDLNDIKTTILRMFLLDYGFSGSFEDYQMEATEIYANTYNPVAQEALENKLIDFRRFNMSLPSMQKESFIPPIITLNNIEIMGNGTASTNIGLFYINAIELVKLNSQWYITGFSTHPHSSETREIADIVNKHLFDIKKNNRTEALKHWHSDVETDFTKQQIKIVEELMSNSDKSAFEIGEIELWSAHEPHRAESASKAGEAKVKILVTTGDSTVKYKLLLSKNSKNGFEITGWNMDPLSISQLH